MKIYIGHSKKSDYKNELYRPIRDDKELSKYEFILPHECSSASSNARAFYRSIDIFIAECSYPATGLGIELGWAYDDNTPIYCIHKKNTKVSGSIYAISPKIYEYSSVDEMLDIIKNIIKLEKDKKD